jgi:hypothetical protein
MSGAVHWPAAEGATVKVQIGQDRGKQAKPLTLRRCLA